MRRLWRDHPRLVLAFALALALSAFFAGRIVVSAVYWSAHRQETLAPWMTLGYVGRSWGIDPRALNAEAGLNLPEGNRLTLEEIARERGMPMADLIEGLDQAIARLGAGAP